MKTNYNINSAVIILALYAAMHINAASGREITSARLQKIESYCYRKNISMAEGRSCLSDQAMRVRRELEAEVRKRYFRIDEIEKRDPSDGGLSGKQDADRWRSAFGDEQKFWSEYEKQRCSNVYDFENSGGSGAGGSATSCSIRLILERLRELQEGY